MDLQLHVALATPPDRHADVERNGPASLQNARHVHTGVLIIARVQIALHARRPG